MKHLLTIFTLACVTACQSSMPKSTALAQNIAPKQNILEIRILKTTEKVTTLKPPAKSPFGQQTNQVSGFTKVLKVPKSLLIDPDFQKRNTVISLPQVALKLNEKTCIENTTTFTLKPVENKAPEKIKIGLLVKAKLFKRNSDLVANIDMTLRDLIKADKLCPVTNSIGLNSEVTFVDEKWQLQGGMSSKMTDGKEETTFILVRLLNHK